MGTDCNKTLCVRYRDCGRIPWQWQHCTPSIFSIYTPECQCFQPSLFAKSLCCSLKSVHLTTCFLCVFTSVYVPPPINWSTEAHQSYRGGHGSVKHEKLQSFMLLYRFSPPVCLPKPHPLRDCACSKPNQKSAKHDLNINTQKRKK